MNNWEEVKTAYHVARLGTVSAAADALGLHRTTIMRHIDSLEAELGQKLFIRHTSGYTPTEAGEEILRIVKITDDQFKRLATRIKKQANSIEGELIVTSIDILSPLLLPTILEFQQKNPQVTIRYVATESILKLEYGEAHIALRAGSKCEMIDNNVQLFDHLEFGLFAHKSYVERKGMLQGMGDLKDHCFVGIGPDSRCRTQFEEWMKKNIPQDNIVLRTSNPFVGTYSIVAGIGIGFMPIYLLKQYPQLVEVLPRQKEWTVPLWLITHTDMHHTEKVQAFLQILEFAKNTPTDFGFRFKAKQR
ncbi:MAG: LysR family transcriptional regulator [Cyanothece sp. SIO2G6]|nr:LysR family transcriptional regulator [Cyanothece sp. SIO2G6]